MLRRYAVVRHPTAIATPRRSMLMLTPTTPMMMT